MAYELVAKNGIITNDDLWFENTNTEKSFVLENSQSSGCNLTLRHTDASGLLFSITTSSINLELPFTSSANLKASYLYGTASYTISASAVTEASTGTGLLVRQTSPTINNLTSSYISASGKILTPLIDVGSGTLQVTARRLALNSFGQSTVVGWNAELNTSVSVSETVVGHSAAQNALTTSFAAIIGSNAGQNIDNAHTSVLIGIQAGQNAKNASSGIFIGGNAGTSAKTANSAVLIGNAVGQSIETGSYSVMLGGYAGNTVKNGLYSVIIGGAAGQYAVDATRAIMIGTYAGYNAKTGSNSILIGYSADAVNNTTDVNNSIAIGYNTKATKANQTVIGNSSTTEAIIYGTLNATGSVKGTASYSNQSANALSLNNLMEVTNAGDDTYFVLNGISDSKVNFNLTVPIYEFISEVRAPKISSTYFSGSKFEALQITSSVAHINGVVIRSNTLDASGVDVFAGSLNVGGSLTSDDLGNVNTIGTITAPNFIGTASVAKSLRPETSSWWIPLTQTVNQLGAFATLDTTIAHSTFLGTSYFGTAVLFASGSNGNTGRMATLENDKIIGNKFKVTGYYAYSHSLVNWAFTPYLGFSGIHMTGSNSKASWSSFQNAVLYNLSGSGITSWSYSATAPSTDYFFATRVGCGWPATQSNNVWLLGIKIENWN